MLLLPPTKPTVSRSPARVDRRMIAHASCPRSASMASRAFADWTSDMREPYFRPSSPWPSLSRVLAGYVPCGSVA